MNKIARIIYIQQYIKNSGYHPPKELYPNFYTYGFGGRLGRIFKKYNPDFDVEIWRLDSSVKEYEEITIENVLFKIFPAKGNKRIGIFSLKFLNQLRSLPENTILNIQNLHTFLTYHILFFAPKRLILTAHHHGDWSPYFKIEWYNGFKKVYAYFLCLLEKMLMNRMNHITIIDGREYIYIKKCFNNADSGIRISNTGIDFTSWKKLHKKEARKELGLEINKKYMFYLGQYYELKDVDKLCEIYKKIKQIYPELKFITAGGTPNDKYYKNVIECGAIDFGRVLNEDLYKFYSAADVYVCISHRPDWFGGIGVAMLESLACGTPVVSNSLNQLPNLNEVKLLGMAPNNDEEMMEHILYVIKHPNEFSECRNIVQKYYDYKYIQLDTREIYEQLLKKTRKK